ncbi:hypothetical protein BH23CHL7_BH23CHL7_08100 [soil metagenome]
MGYTVAYIAWSLWLIGLGIWTHVFQQGLASTGRALKPARRGMRAARGIARLAGS